MAISKVPSSGITADFDNSLTTADLAPNSVDSSELVDGSVDLSHMSANSVDSDQYVDASIDTAHLASDIAISTSGEISTTGGFKVSQADITPAVASIYHDSSSRLRITGGTAGYLFQDDTNATNHLKIDADGNIEIAGDLKLITGGSGTIQKSAASGASTRTVTITGLHATSPGSHWDLVHVLVWRMGIDGGMGDPNSKHWRHHCLGLTTWYMGAATEIWGGTPDVCTQGTVTTSQLQFTVAVVSDYSCLTVQVQAYGMSPKIVIT